METQTTKLFNFRLSIELMDAVKAKAGKTSMTDVVTVALADYVAGGNAAPRVAELEATVASLRLGIDTLARDRDQWRDRAKAIVAATPPTSNAEGRRLARAADPMGRREHAAGPVKASAVPDVDGTVGWCGLKGLDAKAKR